METINKEYFHVKDAEVKKKKSKLPTLEAIILGRKNIIKDMGTDSKEPSIFPNNMIRYKASGKLPETTSNKSGGLHTNAFSGANGQLTITNHTFENGIGTIEFEDDVTIIGSYAFYSAPITEVELPDGITAINNDSFEFCRVLTSIDIPNGVTTIGTSAFAACDVLSSVTFPSTLITIGTNVFASCLKLSTINIPNSVTSIGETVFNGCSGLTSVTIGNSVTSIGYHAFYNCAGLTSITSLATTAPTISSSAFESVKSGGTLYVPQGSTGYDAWMGTGNSYLGKYNWTKVEQ